jgi:pimeloyl-ACP methyl ester carboxylesterase
MSGTSPPERDSLVRLRDGRSIAVAEWGRATGRAVVFLPGSPNVRLQAFGEDLLDELDLRLVVPQRPGFGLSTPKPDRRIAEWPDDLADVADNLGIEEFPIVAFSGGGPFALASASALRSRVTAVAFVAATDEIAHPRFAGVRTSAQERLIELARRDPRAAIDAVARAIADTDTVETVLAASSPRDCETYGADDFRARFTAGVADAERAGKIETAREVVLGTARRWDIDLAAIESPVELWYGRHDWNPGHSPDLGEGLAHQLANARRHVFDDEGGSVLWTRSRTILESVCGN